MKIKTLTYLFLTSIVALASPELGSDTEKDKTLLWEIIPEPELPNVLILGDSISIGYTLPVRARLQDVANVYRPLAGKGPKARAKNCAGTTRGLKSIDSWIGETKWDVIHFNFGLHDLKHSVGGKKSNLETDPQQATPEQYRENLTHIVAKLKATNAKLIFATTTPISPGTLNPLRKPEYPPVYNEIAVEIMQENEIEINDLFALCEPQLARIQKPKNCHFNARGRELQAEQVAKVITAALTQ